MPVSFCGFRHARIGITLDDLGLAIFAQSQATTQKMKKRVESLKVGLLLFALPDRIQILCITDQAIPLRSGTISQANHSP